MQGQQNIKISLNVWSYPPLIDTPERRGP